MNYDIIEEKLLLLGNVNLKGLAYMYCRTNNGEFRNCYEWVLEQGVIEAEIKRICEREYPERVITLIRSYVYRVADRKHEYKKGWNMFIILMNYLKTAGVVKEIYKNHLYKLIGKDYYSNKIKAIVKELQNVRK